jgi:putative nucleotidyltransferase with HDIG domain
VKKKHSSKNIKTRVAATKDVTARKNRKDLPRFNLLIAILCWLAVVALFYSGRLVRPQTLVLGQQAPATIEAEIDFKAKSISATQLKQSEEVEQVLPVFTIDRSAIKRADQTLSKLLPHLRSLSTTTNAASRALLTEMIVDRLDQQSIPLTPKEILQILPPGEPSLKTVVLNALTPLVETGIITATQQTEQFNGIVDDGAMIVREKNDETAYVIHPLTDFVQQERALKTAVKTISSQLPRENNNEDIIRKLVTPWLQANLTYDAAETADRKKKEAEKVEPVIETVPSGTALIRNGETVTEQKLVWLTAHEQRLSELEPPAERIQRVAASGLLLLLGLGLTVAVAGIICRPLLRDRKKVLLLLLLAFIPILFGKLSLHLSVNHQVLSPALIHYLVPPAIAVILASVLLGGKAGILTGLWTSFALSVLLDNSFEVFILGLLVTMTAVYTTRDVKRRSSLFRAGLWIGAIQILFALIMAVLNQPLWPILLQQLGTALVSGLVSALLATLLIPVFEHLFDITTDIRLLELSDLGHPLLQSLAINAPGTYHHSLMLASLAQNAADNIGANGLLLRVCAYFHDIGKLVKPGFFSENIQCSENPHDDLAPSMSTLVIVSHVKEGITLAKKHKLPQVIIDGIEQHQGTSLVSVFYHRAKTQKQKEQAAEGSSPTAINDKDFRYEGPRPQTREMAILMLADSCEAASRSLDKPTPTRIAGIINDIFDARLRDRQLDECNLTFSELDKVKQSFVFSLTNMLHARVAYPKDETGKESSKPETPHDKKHDETKNTH